MAFDGTKGIISSICFKLENGNGKLISSNGQSVTFRFSIIKTWSLKMPKTLIKSNLHCNKHKTKVKPELNNTKSK